MLISRYCIDVKTKNMELVIEILMLTWILGVVPKQLRLLHGRVGDSTTLVNSLSSQMSELGEDAVAS